MAAFDDARRVLLTRPIDQVPLLPPVTPLLAEAPAFHARAARSGQAFTPARSLRAACRPAEPRGTGRGISAVLDGPIPAGVEVEAVAACAQNDVAFPAAHAGEVDVEEAL